MSTSTRNAAWTLALAALIQLCGATASAACKVSETKRKFEGAEHTIVTLQNDRILAEIVPDLEGRVCRYVDKSRPESAFEAVDDCPYHYGGRWEGKPFTYRIEAKGPDRAAVAVQGGGKVAVGLIHGLLGIDMASPLELAVQRTVAIDADTTRLRFDLHVTNVGEGVAPSFRYMVHAVYGGVPAMPGGRAFWFCPTGNGVEFFDSVRGGREMGVAAGGAPVDHPFSRFIPGRKADKPRYEAGGWAAGLTSAGPLFMFYDPKQYDFMQYWHGGDATWHLSLEPHTKAVDLKPGQSVAFSFTLAYDGNDVPFDGGTLAYERPLVPETILQGGQVSVRARATTVRSKPERASVTFEVKDPQGHVLLTKTAGGEVQPFVFTDLAAEARLAETAPMGVYHWRMTGGDGRELAAGTFEVVSAEEHAKRQMAKATAELRAKLDEVNKTLNDLRRMTGKTDMLWRDESNLAWRFEDRSVWPDRPAAGADFAYRPASVPVLGLWKRWELPTFKSFSPAAPIAWPDDAEKLLGLLGADRTMVRDAAPRGRGLAVLLVDRAKRRTEVVLLESGRIGRRFGRFAEKPGETDDTLGAEARAIAVDPEGNLWVATNAWGSTSAYKPGPDGSPMEVSLEGAKGALKKFSPDGRLLGTVSLLDAPMDLTPAMADATPVLLAPYRNVSQYHGAQVREGIMIVRTSDAQRVGEIKAPGGSACVDGSGRLWTADVAGHVACYDFHGRKQFDVARSPAPAIPDARLPASSPVPTVVRHEGKDGVWILSTLAKKLGCVDGKGEARGDALPIAESAGAVWRLSVSPKGPVVIADRALWQP